MAPRKNEQREFLRVPLSTAVEIETEESTIRSSSGVDVSMNGLRLSTDRKIPIQGASCTVRILIGGADLAVKARGTVVRSAPGAVAVEFDEVDFESYHHLRRLIASNAEDPERAEKEFDEHWGIRRPKA